MGIECRCYKRKRSVESQLRRASLDLNQKPSASEANTLSIELQAHGGNSIVKGRGEVNDDGGLQSRTCWRRFHRSAGIDTLNFLYRGSHPIHPEGGHGLPL